MSQMNTEVVGVIEMELDAERFRVWLDDDVPASSSETPHVRQNSVSVTADVVIADVTQLSDDLHVELVRVLHRLLNSR